MPKPNLQERHDRLRDVLTNLLRVLELDDIPGYVYDANRAECVDCTHTAPTIATVVHDKDCLQAAIEQASKEIGVTPPVYSNVGTTSFTD